MIRYLTFEDVVASQEEVIARSGGGTGILDRGLIESAVAQPRMTFGGEDLYPTIAEKAAAMGFSLARNHGFRDGNKRIGHAAMETYLVLNGFEIVADVDDQEAVMLRVAAGELTREQFLDWIRPRISPIDPSRLGPG